MKIKGKVILKRKPAEYLRQGLLYCGGYVVKGILSAFGKDDRKNPEEYVPFHSIATSNFIVRKLKEYGLNARAESASNLEDGKRLRILKNHLRKGFPVILRIGNGYMGNGRFNTLKALIFGHWISVWGFSDNKKVFYVKILENHALQCVENLEHPKIQTNCGL